MLALKPLLARPHRPYLSLGIALAASTALVHSSMSTSTAPLSSDAASYTITPYQPRHTTWPYRPADFARQDPSSDAIFYRPSRLVTHIDDAAIASLGRYYDTTLPRSGQILDFCSSWVSHFPPSLTAAVQSGSLRVTGAGMNQAELDANPLLTRRVVRDLNAEPVVPEGPYDAATCVVSIDYLVKPVEVLQSLRAQMKPGGTVHLVVSNRCFPTKAIARWLRVSEDERLLMVGDYLHFAGWEGIEILDLKEKSEADANQGGGLGGFMRMMGMGEDPLWVVRGRNGKLEAS